MPGRRRLEQAVNDLLQPKEIDHSDEATASQSEESAPSAGDQNGDREDGPDGHGDEADAAENDGRRLVGSRFVILSRRSRGARKRDRRRTVKDLKIRGSGWNRES